MSAFKDSDFQDMVFPFHRVNKNLLAQFPKLAELYRNIPEFDDDKNPIPGEKYLPEDEVILYVGYAYDKGSPLQKIENIQERKVQAALMAGIVANDRGEFQPDMVRIFECKDISVNEMIVRYCRLMRSHLYSLIVAGSEILHQTTKQLMNSVGDDAGERLSLLDKLRDSTKEMDELYVELLRDDNKRLNEYLYLVTNNMTQYINLTPEDYSLLDQKRPTLKIQTD